MKSININFITKIVLTPESLTTDIFYLPKKTLFGITFQEEGFYIILYNGKKSYLGASLDDEKGTKVDSSNNVYRLTRLSIYLSESKNSEDIFFESLKEGKKAYKILRKNLNYFEIQKRVPKTEKE